MMKYLTDQQEKRLNFDNVVRFHIPMEPIPLQRPRLSRYKIYDPQSTIKHQVACLIRSQWNKISLVGNLFLQITCYFKIPSSWSRKLKEKVAAKRKGTRPDLSNCIKFYEDVLQDIGIFKDDAQIVEIKAEKLYDDGQGARVEILIREIDDGAPEKTTRL